MFTDQTKINVANGNDLAEGFDGVPVYIRDVSPGTTTRVNGNTSLKISHVNAKVLGLDTVRSLFRVDEKVDATETVPEHTLTAYLIVHRPVIGSKLETKRLALALAATIVGMKTYNGATTAVAIDSPALFDPVRFIDGEI